jgi:hypothetical protein
MKCRFCYRKLNKNEWEGGRCSDRIDCANRVQRRLNKQLRTMVTKPMFRDDRSLRAAYEASPKLGDG